MEKTDQELMVEKMDCLIQKFREGMDNLDRRLGGLEQSLNGFEQEICSRIDTADGQARDLVRSSFSLQTAVLSLSNRMSQAGVPARIRYFYNGQSEANGNNPDISDY